MWCCDASTFTEHENPQTSKLNIKNSGEHNKTQCPDHRQHSPTTVVCVCFLPIYSGRQIRCRGHKGFLIHFPSTVRAFIFLVKMIQPCLSLVDREVDLRKNPSYRDSNSRPNVSEGYQLSYQRGKKERE